VTKIPCPYCDTLINVSKDSITGVYCGKKEDHYSSKCTECGKPFYLETDSNSGSEKPVDNRTETTTDETNETYGSSEKSVDNRTETTTDETNETYGKEEPDTGGGTSSGEENSSGGGLLVIFGILLNLAGLAGLYFASTSSSIPSIGGVVVFLGMVVIGWNLAKKGDSLMDQD
jgi:hypothetical protein